jgi:YD repeat-containing protein
MLVLGLAVVQGPWTGRAGDAAALHGQVVDSAEGPRFELRWMGLEGARYRVQQRGGLDAPEGWQTRDLVRTPSDGAPARWMAPEALRQQRYYRLAGPEAEIFAVEPAIAPPNAPVTLYLTGQCFGSNDTVRLGGNLVPGANILSSALIQADVPPQPPGTHRVELVRDGVVLSFFDVFFFDPGSDPFISLQEPPTLPPAAPSVGGGAASASYASTGMAFQPSPGEWVHWATDLATPGRGLDFVWTRTYRSRTGGDSPMGWGWTHSYDIRIQPGPNGSDSSPTKVWCFDGTGRRDELARQTNDTYTASGLFREGTLSNDVFRLTFADSGYWEFLPFDGTAAAGRIARSVDRNGNTMRFEYEAGRLVRIIDTLDRTNTVAYNAEGRIASLTDFSGRRVSYTYVRSIMDLAGSVGDLKSVTSPSVTGTSTGNDFPSGKTTTYTYTRGFADDRLNHNLRIAYDAPGQPQVELVYASTEDPTSFDFDTVQTVLRGASRLDLQREPLTPSPTNDFATVRCIVNDFVGNVTEEYYDARHRLVRRLEFTGRANPAEPTTGTLNRPTGKLRPDDPDFFESRWSWNNDSLCTAWQRPQTNRMEWVYQADLEPGTPPRHRGNLRVERRVPVGDLDGDGRPDIVVATFEHDPRFGSDRSARFTPEYVDGRYNLRAGALSAPWQYVNPLDLDDFVSTRTTLFASATRILNPRGCETRCEYDARGNLLTRTRHGRVSRTNTQPTLAREDFEYNAHGQLTAITNAADAEGRRRADTFTYHTSGPQRGYLANTVVDAGPAGLALTTSYEYDARGNLTRVTDPRGTSTDFEVNALNQTVTRQTQGATFGERVSRRYFYDANNNVVQVDIENRDGDGSLNPTNAWFTTLYQYDPLQRLNRLLEEESVTSYLTNEFAYDGNDQLVLRRSPAAVHGLDPFAVTQTAYDERGLLFRETRAPGSPLQSTTQFDYDGNGNLRATRAGLEEATGPCVTEYAYDGLDRRIRATDAMGNETRYEYDLNGNVTRVTSYGETNDVPGSAGNRRLAETRYEYDSLDRCVRFRPAFFDIFTELSIGDGFQDHTLEHAPNGQVTRTTNDRGFGLRYAYDTAGRLIRKTDAKTNHIEYTYDANSNVLTATQTGRSDVGGPDEIFVRSFSYDALDRCVADWDNVGNTNRYAYDSRGNLVRHTDPLGFRLDGDFDSISRPTSRKGGVGGSAQQSTHYTWDANSRLVAVTDGNSNTTQYAYDSLDRLVRTTLADGTISSLVWSPRSNVERMTDANGTVVVHTYDALDRCVQKDIKPGPGVAGSTTRENFQYDGLSRLVRAANNQTDVTLAYDSLGRCVREGTLSPALGLALAQTRWDLDAHGLVLAQTNPSGRVIEYAYDALDRPAMMGWRAGGGLPRQSLGTLAYVGPCDARRVTRPNGVQTDYVRSGVSGVANPPGDFGWGQIQRVRHAVGGTTPVIDERVFAHDRNQNKTLRALTVLFAPGTQTNRQEFQYDSLNRLVQSATTAAGLPVRDAGYLLDPMGNRQSVISGGMDHPYLLDPTLPQPADFQVNQYTVTPFDARQYDENGNLHQTVGGEPTDPLVRVFSYDYADRLVAVQGASGPVAQYAYDALGRRIAKVVYAGLPPVPVQTNRYLYAGGQVIEEHDGGGAVARTYAMPHVFDQKGRATISGGGEVLFHHCDDQGSLLALTDAAGNVVERFDYDDYGAPQFLDTAGNPRPGATASLTGVTHLFHGLQWDEESGLYFISVGKLGGVFGKIKHSPLLKKLGPAAQEPTCLDPNTGSTLSRTYAMPHVFDQKGRAYAGNNPWSLKQEEGGRHAPFQNRIASFFDIWTELSAARIIIADNGVKPGSVNRAAGGPGGAHLGSVNVKLIVPVAMDKGLRFGVLKTRHDTVKNTIQNVR